MSYLTGVEIHMFLNSYLFFIFIYASLMDGILFCPGRAIVGDVCSTILKCTCEFRKDEPRERKYCNVKSLIIRVLFMVGIAQSVQRRARSWKAEVQFSVGSGAFLYSTSSRTITEPHPASCPMDTEGNATEK
jgi:hypothetical protein